MADMATYSSQKDMTGCGFIGGIFHCRSHFPRNTTIPNSHSVKKIQPDKKPVKKALQLHSPPRSAISHQKKHVRRTSNAARSSTSSSTTSGQTMATQAQELVDQRRVLKVPTCNSTELIRMRNDQQLCNDNRTLVRATSGNVLLLGHLGNLRQQGNGNFTANNNPNATIRTVDNISKNLLESNSLSHHKYGHIRPGSNGTMGNIVRQPSDEFRQARGLMNGEDSEALKAMGNEAYRRGKFEEALGLYDRAIGLDSHKAVYRSNKSAALIGLGRILEAVFECKLAIQIDPSYHRAHHRLATLYFRLGEAEKALYHYKQLGPNVDSKELAKAQTLQKHLTNCNQTWKFKEWSILLKEAQCAISLGTDSAPQVYAMQSDALMKLHRHQEAYEAYKKGPTFSIDAKTKLFGLSDTIYQLSVEAHLCLVAGRFEHAVAKAQQAARLDPGNKEVSVVLKRTRAVASARLSGNLLFKASKFQEACVVYSEGLEHDPHNSILLCNRAACRSKLGQFEKAIEDCNVALYARPNYSKARLRRADCNTKMERWEASIRDYEMLIRETPGDEEVAKALFDAQLELKKQRGEDIKNMKFGSNLIFITSNERFRHFITSPGLSVVLFCNKTNHKQVLQLMEQVCKRFPSVNFLKVEIEDHPYLAKSEGVKAVPAFKIYKNGSKVKEIAANDSQSLESSVKLYSNCR